MLQSLHIKNIVLIEELALDFGNGLSVVTGETGAGKSILLDAFSLALGARGDANLVRVGAEKGSVIATFQFNHNTCPHAILQILDAHDIDLEDGELILRRLQHSDGRSRAFVNAIPVNMTTLRAIGAHLVEIHGQHDDRAMVDPSTHRALLDIYGGHANQLARTADEFEAWKAAKQQHQDHQDWMRRQEEEREYITHAAEELNKLAPEAGEEERLAKDRHRFMSAEKLKSDLEEALNALGGPNSPTPAISSVLRKLERKAETDDPVLSPIIKSLDTALIQIESARDDVEAALGANAYSQSEMDIIEERLFALRAASRKYQCQVDQLPEKAAAFETSLQSLVNGEAELERLSAQERAAANAYKSEALKLSEMRSEAAMDLNASIAQELPPLKLEHARIETRVTPKDIQEGGATGIDQVEFWAQTNPGTRPGPLMKIASGGELSRFMLALKVVLADRGSAPTLIFDEIDTGVGGAVADAMGWRLARLGKHIQVLAVTHAPQVAAQAKSHLYISKRPNENGNKLSTDVIVLEDVERLEEIARMLSGQDITDEARAAASALMTKALEEQPS